MEGFLRYISSLECESSIGPHRVVLLEFADENIGARLAHSTGAPDTLGIVLQSRISS